MLLLFSILLILFCTQESKNTAKEIVISNQPAPEIVLTQPTAKNPVKFMLYNGSTAYLYDGTNLTTWKTGISAYGKNRYFSNLDILYLLDQYGNTVSSVQLPAIASKIIKTDTDIWTFEAVNGTDTRVWQNYGQYSYGTYLTDSVQNTLSGFITTRLPNRNFQSINSPYVTIQYSDDIVIHNYDYLARTAILNDGTNHAISWSTNYLTRVPDWIKSGNKWYSGNGYTWDGVNFLEAATPMWNFNVTPYPVTLPWPESPTPGIIGTRLENSEDVIYLIEYNTGIVLKYIPSINNLSQAYRIYVGDGTRQSGLVYRSTVKPIFIGDYLYFHNGGSLYELNTVTGLARLFYAGTAEIWPF